MRKIMKVRMYELFGGMFGIYGKDDDIQTWVHELTEMFLYQSMRIWHSVDLEDIEHLLESKDYSPCEEDEEEEDWVIDICHLAAPYGYNCLIGRRRNL